jgi:hypothetical protein
VVGVLAAHFGEMSNTTSGIPPPHPFDRIVTSFDETCSAARWQGLDIWLSVVAERSVRLGITGIIRGGHPQCNLVTEVERPAKPS